MQFVNNADDNKYIVGKHYNTVVALALVIDLVYDCWEIITYSLQYVLLTKAITARLTLDRPLRSTNNHWNGHYKTWYLPMFHCPR